jgi:8-oxo-dGTP pyrophosphatase MutT (NUDIX family)
MSKEKWKISLQKSLINLPGEDAHLEMIPFRKPSSSFKSTYNTAKHSAVMCLIFENNNELFGLLMERTEDGGTHSGQISFPGGKKEMVDQNLQETALRETHEEIGIHHTSVTVLGALTSVYIPVSNFLVQPFIGIIEPDFELNLSQVEVKSVFDFSIKDLLNPESTQLQTIKNHEGVNMKNIPCFVLNNRNVWGATAVILNEVKRIFQNVK